MGQLCGADMRKQVSNSEHTDVTSCLSGNGAFIVQRTVTALNIRSLNKGEKYVS